MIKTLIAMLALTAVQPTVIDSDTVRVAGVCC
jgi:hypothetical protein